MRTRLLIPALLTAALALSGCTGSSEGGGSDGGDDSEALAARLATAKTTIDDAETIAISLSTKKVPDGVTGLLSAEGKGNHTPAFEGKVTVVTGGASLGADVIAVDGKVYAKSGLLPQFVSVDPDTLKAPDPASLMSADDGVTQILTATDDLEAGDQSRDGKDVLTTITGTLPGSLVKTIIPSAAEDTTFTVAYRLDDDDVLRDATLTGQFYPTGGDVTYTVAIETSDQPITVEAP